MGIQIGPSQVPAPGIQYDLQTALPPRGCVLGSTSTKCCERDGYDSGEGGQHKEEVAACVWHSPWATCQLCDYWARHFTSLCLRFPAVKWVIVMVPTLQVPQEGCEHSANEFVCSIGTVTGTQEACADVSCSHCDRERSDQSDSSMVSGNSQGK